MNRTIHETEPQSIGNNIYIPSVKSLETAVINKTDYDHTNYPNAVPQGKYRILVLCVEEEFLEMANGKIFSTGNHPVETFLPILHLEKAGFDIDFFTINGNRVVFEQWAMPDDDKNIMDAYRRFMSQWENPKSLMEFINNHQGEDFPYEAIFIPGGHGAVINLPHSEVVGQLLRWVYGEDKFIISMCHGPSSFISASIGEPIDEYIFKDYEIVAFPDAVDDAGVKPGYIPGPMPWHFCAKLESLGVNVINKNYTGQTHKDRKVITGDGPKSGNELGKLAAHSLLELLNSK